MVRLLGMVVLISNFLANYYWLTTAKCKHLAAQANNICSENTTVLEAGLEEARNHKHLLLFSEIHL